MDLLIIRHAIAMDRDEFASTGKADDLRPLTDEGRQKMKRNAKGLRALVPRVDAIAASPLLRARQTATIVAQLYDLDDIETAEFLKPDSAFPAFGQWLTRRGKAGVVAVVGHEPHLSALATWLISGADRSGLDLKKGGACFVSFDGAPGRGTGILQWLVTPRQLGRLAG